MKFTVSQLKQIIKEEIEKAIFEESEEDNKEKESSGEGETSQKAQKASKEEEAWKRVYGTERGYRGGYRGKDYPFHGSGPKRSGRRRSDADIYFGR